MAEQTNKAVEVQSSLPTIMIPDVVAFYANAVGKWWNSDVCCNICGGKAASYLYYGIEYKVSITKCHMVSVRAFGGQLNSNKNCCTNCFGNLSENDEERVINLDKKIVEFRNCVNHIPGLKEKLGPNFDPMWNFSTWVDKRNEGYYRECINLVIKPEEWNLAQEKASQSSGKKDEKFARYKSFMSKFEFDPEFQKIMKEHAYNKDIFYFQNWKNNDMYALFDKVLTQYKL